jgi:hypothetical protein
MRHPIKKVVPEPVTADEVPDEHHDTGATHIIVIHRPLTEADRAKVLKLYPNARIVEQA